MKIGYISLGCPKNRVDFEYLIGELSEDGFEAEPDLSKCDAAIINTCGFIEPAVREAIDNILLTAASLPKRARLIVTGCAISRYKDDIKKEMPEIDFIAGAGELSKAAEYLRNLRGISAGEREKRRILTNEPYYAYVKISEGCDNRCSYCAIPAIRGPLKSRREEDIENETATLEIQGVKEIVLISQDTTKYASDLKNGSSAASLIKRLSSRFPNLFFRLLYLNPDGVTEDILRIAAEAPNIIKYFEIPIQHASDRILKSMGRRSDRSTIDRVFDGIRKKMPEAFIRTTFIVGFPGEEEEDFEILHRFIEEKKPDFAGFFPYYKEEGTKAAALDGVPPPKTVKNRIKILETLQKKNTAARLKEFKNKDFLCFIDKANDDFDFILEGRALFQAPDIDGKIYITEGEASRGSGPYICRATRVVYPDIYATIKGEAPHV